MLRIRAFDAAAFDDFDTRHAAAAAASPLFEAAIDMSYYYYFDAMPLIAAADAYYMPHLCLRDMPEEDMHGLRCRHCYAPLYC